MDSPFYSFTISDIISDEQHFGISLDGYFILQGDFMLNDGYGDCRFYFIPSDIEGKNFCENRIKINDQLIIDLAPNVYMIRNDDMVERELGTSLCEKLDQELYNNNNWIKVHATAVFSNYSMTGWYESEGHTFANLISILEIEELSLDE